jgi:hypothetical protein
MDGASQDDKMNLQGGNASPDAVLEREIENLLASVGAIWEKTYSTEAGAGPLVEFRVGVRVGFDLKVWFVLVADQMDVLFNECRMTIEESAYLPRVTGNASSREDWRNECLTVARDIVTRDLRVETRWRGGRLLGGFLYTWTGSVWEHSGGGGSVLLGFGSRRFAEYKNWLARA